MGVTVFSGVSVPGVVVGGSVLMTNRFGVFVGCNEKGVAVGCGEDVAVGVCRNGMEIGGSPLQPVRRKIDIKMTKDRFIIPHASQWMD
jgi:hypothetical protein